MGIGTSILLIAVGAILKYAVNADVEGVEIDTVGTILLIIGIIGLVISLLYMFIWSDRARRTDVVDDVPPRDRYPRY
jgi:beta-lactamase regulating signal transducer with metallopeptidase domain